jgi:hypothetical protein
MVQKAVKEDLEKKEKKALLGQMGHKVQWAQLAPEVKEAVKVHQVQLV